MTPEPECDFEVEIHVLLRLKSVGENPRNAIRPVLKVLVKARSLHRSRVISYGVGAYSPVESFVVERCCSVFGC